MAGVGRDNASPTYLRRTGFRACRRGRRVGVRDCKASAYVLEGGRGVRDCDLSLRTLEIEGGPWLSRQGAAPSSCGELRGIGDRDPSRCRRVALCTIGRRDGCQSPLARVFYWVSATDSLESW